MNVLIAYFTQTGNTEKVAKAIHEEVLSKGHEACLKRVEEITSDSLDDYDLVFLGSACHSRDLAQPVKQILEDISSSPRYKLAGFVTHSTYTSEGDERKRELYLQWASKCIESFERTSEEKKIDFLGFFNCQGAPSPPIEKMIHEKILTDENEWLEYIKKARDSPNEEDLGKAKEFARQVLSKC